MNYNVRISDNFLRGDHVDGEVLQHTDLNELENVAKTAINANYEDIQKMQDGTISIANSEKFDGASLSKFADETLQNSDTKVPTSMQTKNYIDSAISSIDLTGYYTKREVDDILDEDYYDKDAVDDIADTKQDVVFTDYINTTFNFNTCASGLYHLKNCTATSGIETFSVNDELYSVLDYADEQSPVYGTTYNIRNVMALSGFKFKIWRWYDSSISNWRYQTAGSGELTTTREVESILGDYVRDNQYPEDLGSDSSAGVVKVSHDNNLTIASGDTQAETGWLVPAHIHLENGEYVYDEKFISDGMYASEEEWGGTVHYMSGVIKVAEDINTMTDEDGFLKPANGTKFISDIDLTNYYTKQETNTLLNGKANTSDIPTKTSDLQNDSGFITNAVDNLTNYYTKTEIDNTIGDISSVIDAISGEVI